jgi:hypothetical protein
VSRRTLRLVTLAALLIGAAATASFAAGPVEPKAKDPAALHERGTIVDCTDYMLMGKKGPERRDFQAKSIDSGMPACFLSSRDGEVYLLLELGTQAREKFQPTPTFIAAEIEMDGVVYQRGSLKALAINEIKRTGGYTDRESRRPDNPEPTRLTNQKDPKKSPYVPTVPNPQAPEVSPSPK